MYGSTEQRSPALTFADAGADVDDFDAQLVTGDAGIAEERHLAEIAADVGSANADPMDAHQSLAGAGLGRLWNVETVSILWGFEL